MLRDPRLDVVETVVPPGDEEEEPDGQDVTRGERAFPVERGHGVQLVLTGHEHAYERSTVDGMTHVVSGHGGSTLLPFPFPQAPWSVFRDGRYGHLEIEVQRDRLVGRMVTRDGDVVDSFWVPPSQAVDGAAHGAALLQRPRRRRVSSAARV